jgi:hypothetical protein
MTFFETQEQVAEMQLLTNTPIKNWPPMAKLQDYLFARCGFKFSALASAELKTLVLQASITHLRLSATSSLSSVAETAASSSSNSLSAVAQMVDEDRGEQISDESEEESQLVDMAQGAAASDCFGAPDEFDIQS